VENSADVVLFVYRDEYYNKETSTPNTAEVIVAKNRHGETGQLDLYWDAQRATFKNLARENLRL
ncbi:DnaB-like helicase C-terminal domain-containing protein, partial [Streptococcus pneumoniae]|uniref:DnaB-like helicase C-terminal domain-containing protein n=1 Tax=Streptococcus pneumoniae TaxID=1313 RepID=UPI00139BE92C